MPKHQIKYNIVKEALAEYIKNKQVIPMYNKKQIKEEFYKLEDLENSKAFLVDYNARKKVRVDIQITKHIIIDMLCGFIKRDQGFNYIGSNTMYSKDTKQKYENVDTYIKLGDKETRETRMENLVWVIEELLCSGNFRNYITKDQVKRLVISTENLPSNE
jgi:hypothetical protein|tara:strand:- start:2461 stop:2940 length:480 start_codon:yes stop_codon:yes gene_type:complete